MYWIWKNYHDAEYVGLTQYRRQFAEKFTAENIDGFFADGTDVILAKKYFRPHNRFWALLTYIQAEDFLILKGVLRKLYPEYMPSFNRFLRGYVDHPFNMVICRKELYNEYASWVFSICDEMEKYVMYSGYTNSSRLFGYIIEFLTPLYFLHNKFKIKEMQVLLAGSPIETTMINKVRKFVLQNTIYRLTKNIPISMDASIARGLNRDGICLDFD